MCIFVLSTVRFPILYPLLYGMFYFDSQFSLLILFSKIPKYFCFMNVMYSWISWWQISENKELRYNETSFWFPNCLCLLFFSFFFYFSYLGISLSYFWLFSNVLAFHSHLRIRLQRACLWALCVWSEIVNRPVILERRPECQDDQEFYLGHWSSCQPP